MAKFANLSELLNYRASLKSAPTSSSATPSNLSTPKYTKAQLISIYQQGGKDLLDQALGKKPITKDSPLYTDFSFKKEARPIKYSPTSTTDEDKLRDLMQDLSLYKPVIDKATKDLEAAQAANDVIAYNKAAKTLYNLYPSYELRANEYNKLLESVKSKQPKEEVKKASEPSGFLGKTNAVIEKVMNPISNVVMGFFQVTARTGARIGLALQPYQGNEKTSSEVPGLKVDERTLSIDKTAPKLQQAIQELLFGKEPVETFSAQLEHWTGKLKEWGFQKTALPIALIGIAGNTALDFTGVGGEKNALKVLAKEKDAGKIAEYLVKIGVDGDLALNAADKLKDVTKAADIKVILDKLKYIQRTTEPAAKTAFKTVVEPDLSLQNRILDDALWSPKNLSKNKEELTGLIKTQENADKLLAAYKAEKETLESAVKGETTVRPATYTKEGELADSSATLETFGGKKVRPAVESLEETKGKLSVIDDAIDTLTALKKELPTEVDYAKNVSKTKRLASESKFIKSLNAVDEDPYGTARELLTKTPTGTKYYDDLVNVGNKLDDLIKKELDGVRLTDAEVTEKANLINELTTISKKLIKTNNITSINPPTDINTIRKEVFDWALDMANKGDNRMFIRDIPVYEGKLRSFDQSIKEGKELTREELATKAAIEDDLRQIYNSEFKEHIGEISLKKVRESQFNLGNKYAREKNIAGPVKTITKEQQEKIVDRLVEQTKKYAEEQGKSLTEDDLAVIRKVFTGGTEAAIKEAKGPIAVVEEIAKDEIARSFKLEQNILKKKKVLINKPADLLLEENEKRLIKNATVNAVKQYRELQVQLAEAIKAGKDDVAEEIKNQILKTFDEDKLAVSNPRYVPKTEDEYFKYVDDSELNRPAFNYGIRGKVVNLYNKLLGRKGNKVINPSKLEFSEDSLIDAVEKVKASKSVQETTELLKALGAVDEKEISYAAKKLTGNTKDKQIREVLTSLKSNDIEYPYVNRPDDAYNIIMKRFARSGITVLERMGSYGKAIATKFREIEAKTATTVGNVTTKFKDVFEKIPKDDRWQLTSLIRGKIDVKNVSTEVKAAYEEFKSAIDSLYDKLDDLGIPSGDKKLLSSSDGTIFVLSKGRYDLPEVIRLYSLRKYKDYQDEIIKSHMLLGDFKTYDEGKEYLEKFLNFIDSGGEDRSFINLLVRRTGKSSPEVELSLRDYLPKSLNAPQISTSKYVQPAQILLYDTDAGRIVPDTLSSTWRRLYEIEQFGLKDEIFHSLKNQLVKQGEDYNVIKKIFDVEMDRIAYDPNSRRVQETLADLATVKLVFSQILQITQSSNIAGVSSLKNTLKGLIVAFTKAGKQEHLLAGAAFSKSYYKAITNYAESRFGERTMKSTGMTFMDDFMRRWATNTAKYEAPRLLEKAVKGSISKADDKLLRDLLVTEKRYNDAITRGKLTEADQKIAEFMFTKLTQFTVRPADLPYGWRDSVVAKQISMFKSFAFLQGYFTKKYILQSKSPARFFKYVPAALITADVANEVRSWIKGKERPKMLSTERLIEDLSMIAAGGLVADMFNTVNKGYSLAEYAVGPVYSDLFNIGTGVYDVATGNFKTGVKNVYSDLPLILNANPKTAFLTPYVAMLMSAMRSRIISSGSSAGPKVIKSKEGTYKPTKYKPKEYKTPKY